jgi:hypothetical protein
MNPRARSNAASNARSFRSISYILVFLMITCFILAIGALIQNAMPDWPASIMTGIMLLLVIDRLLTYQRFKSLPVFTPEWFVAVGTQWIVFVIFIRLLLSYAKGLSAFVEDLSLFAHGYLENFFSPEFMVTLWLAGFAWSLPAQFLELLDEIGADQAQALRETPPGVPGNAIPVHQRLVNLVFSMGIVLVILAALALVDLRATLINPAAPTFTPDRFTSVQAGVLLYFILGLALLSQSRLMSLQTRWNIQRIPIASDNLSKQWGSYSLFFLFLIVVIVSLLPTGDSLGLFSLLAALIDFLLGVLFFLAQLFLLLVVLLFSLPLLLLGLDALPGQSPLPPPVLPPAPETPPLFVMDSPIWTIIRSVLLWGALILIVGFSVRSFIRQHGDLPAALRKVPVLNWLILAWEWLRRSMDRTRVGLVRAVADGWQGIVSRLERRGVQPGTGWISLRSLDPRRQIYFFYHAMLRRSARAGLTRKPFQTPSEYADLLEKGLPTAGEDIAAITGAFVEARYSGHEVHSKQADDVKTVWGRIRQALQERSSRERAGKK